MIIAANILFRDNLNGFWNAPKLSMSNRHLKLHSIQFQAKSMFEILVALINFALTLHSSRFNFSLWQ